MFFSFSFSIKGWLKRVDGSSLTSFRKPENPKNVVKNEVDYDDAKLLFIEVLTIFFKEVFGSLCYRPLPPMLGDGKSVDLFKLYLVVRKNGGYQRVSENGLWGLVGKDCGFDLSYGLAVKLVYVKYLDALEKWMLRLKNIDSSSIKSEVRKCDLGSCGDGVPMDVELDLKEILMKISDEKAKDGENANCKLRKKGFDTTDGNEARDFDGLNESAEKFDGQSNLDSNAITVKDIDETSEEEHLKFVNGRESVSVLHGTDDSLTKSSVVEEDCISRKRKRESYLDLVKWVSEVAKNPCDLAIGTLPERSKWKDYGTEVIWKQVLLLRDEMLLKRDVDPCAQYSIWQKMHPSMYDESSGSGRLRCSQRVLSAKDHLKKRHALQFSVSPSSSHNEEDQLDGPTDSSAESAIVFWWKQRRKRIPVGPQFQADIPEWIEEIYESDSKWLGTGIWPLDKRGKKRTLIDRGPIGKGRQDICGCKSRGSYDCVKFHLSEKRRKLKIDLGSAYCQWKFDSMGEEVALSWSREEERKFQDIVKSNPLSEEKSFWNEIFKFFPNKSRESLVSYYFNVFLLRRRGNQNRTNASNVDSDDDESEYGPRFDCFGRDAKLSIFRSPRKSTSGSEVVHES
ncbi:AT-rich interactive domain-containing protein 1-like isoform X2 [Solanum dulcamara]|uniref:AT-rich interactive domain-containing protein 1-like isoform X2 n=1 Tax=Solanum dulcamara TaxID=45834 RepID=UPI0024858FD2|nr:AT-rich interactive domain-containing protein 1-like isoform X2 [Solanum dulcamara]